MSFFLLLDTHDSKWLMLHPFTVYFVWHVSWKLFPYTLCVSRLVSCWPRPIVCLLSWNLPLFYYEHYYRYLYNPIVFENPWSPWICRGPRLFSFLFFFPIYHHGGTGGPSPPTTYSYGTVTRAVTWLGPKLKSYWGESTIQNWTFSLHRWQLESF